VFKFSKVSLTVSSLYLKMKKRNPDTCWISRNTVLSTAKYLCNVSKTDNAQPTRLFIRHAEQQ